MQLRAFYQDDFLIDVEDVRPTGESSLDEILREPVTCLRRFDNKGGSRGG